MTKREYINKVLFLMNEAGMTEREGFEFEGGDDSAVVNHIITIYPEAWQQSLSICPYSWANVADFGIVPVDLGNGSGYVVLPDDFYVLRKFKMKRWQRAVFRCAEEDDEVGRMQANVYARGTALHPVCVLGYNAEGKKVMYYYSIPQGQSHELECALYIPYCQGIEGADDDFLLDADIRFANVVCYMAASLVYGIMENYTASKSLKQGALQLINRYVGDSEHEKE